jgi:hypothetical protein
LDATGEGQLANEENKTESGGVTNINCYAKRITKSLQSRIDSNERSASKGWTKKLVSLRILRAAKRW